MAIPIIDVFAGPGGLGEGFSSLRNEAGEPVFSIAASIEMDGVACQTLRLRSLYRKLRGNQDLESLYWQFVSQKISHDEFISHDQIWPLFAEASTHVHQIELGSESQTLSDKVIRDALDERGILENSFKPWVLIGGPPCQAYSLAGRSRRANDETFASDKRHFLYQEYLHILAEFKPALFIMENVKGLLSAQATGDKMFQKILGDLSKPSDQCQYEIHSVVVNNLEQKYEPNDFVVRSEDYGIPQKRHRVILLGIRKDFSSRIPPFDKTLTPAPLVTVRDAISDLPQLRSGITPKTQDNYELWSSIRDELLAQYGTDTLRASAKREYTLGNGWTPTESLSINKSVYSRWVRDGFPGFISHHQARSHMKMDLARYFYYATIAANTGISIKITDLPNELTPAHKNVTNPSGHFSDRFRVQLWDKPSSTVVSHISKDGHYYIHPDPLQMRSLTVREAARLQTFPDSYHFMGNRTQQYHQVGNAVPPLLAKQIAELVEEYLAPSSGI